MRLSIFASPVLTVIFACGPGQPSDSDTDPTTSSSTTTSPVETTTSPVETTESVEPTTTEPEPRTTGEPEPGTTGEPATGTTGEPATGGPTDTGIVAQFWFGGLDHLHVRMADFKDDLCVSIRFARPGGSEWPGLTLPTDWWYQGATISQGTVDCFDFEAALPDVVVADSVAGEGDWDPVEFCPKTLDLDLVLTFPQDQPWVPAEATVAATALPVQGC